MQKLLPTTSLGLGHPSAHRAAPAAESASLLLALWRRKWTLLLTIFVCVGAASVYLLVATRVFSATATVMIDQNNVKAFSENHAFITQSDSYLQTQADVFRS